MGLIIGLITGIVFGFLLKRIPFCLTGLFRDAAGQKRWDNLLLAALIIMTESTIYQVLVTAGLIRGITYFTPFSIVAIAVGSFVFGIGAVLSDGCLTKTLIKCGDGRADGLITLVSFLAGGYLVSAGPLSMFTYKLQRAAIAYDEFPLRGTPALLAVTVVVEAVLIVILMKRRKAKPAGKGLSYELFHGNWTRETSALAIGIWMGAGYLLSDLAGRHYGFAAAMPILSWLFALIHPKNVVGGCNTYDQKFGFGSMFVLGIVIGGFLAAAIGKNLKWRVPKPSQAIQSLIGGFLMGVGAIWGMGCLLSNGYVGTSQFSLKSWYALAFLILGIGLAAVIKNRKQSAS